MSPLITIVNAKPGYGGQSEVKAIEFLGRLKPTRYEN